MAIMTELLIVDRTVSPTAIDGLLLITMRQVTDERGTIREFARHSTGAVDFPTAGDWQQVNVTATEYGAVRGLHGEHMTKLVGMVHGAGFGAYVDARPHSPTRGALVTADLTPGSQVLVPAGVCNGFQSVSPGPSLYLYCFDAEWSAGMSGVAVNPLDPELAITWPIAVDPQDRGQISAKDVALPNLGAVLAGASG
jgi:dTDP-4-dehydrorhamnose 3,5-epimerase